MTAGAPDMVGRALCLLPKPITPSNREKTTREFLMAG